MRVFLNHDAVQFVAGRIFPHGGRTYYPGQHVEDARSWPNLEAVVRSKYLWPVVDDLEDIPHHMRKQVKQRDDAMRRLRADRYVTDPQAEEPIVDVALPEPEAFDPELHKISEVQEYLSVHPEDTEAVLERERAGKNRVRLITELEERLTAPEENIDV